MVADRPGSAADAIMAGGAIMIIAGGDKDLAGRLNCHGDCENRNSRGPPRTGGRRRVIASSPLRLPRGALSRSGSPAA